MTIEQIQAAIDAKADARQIINMIADYIQDNPGGGGGLTLYNGNGALSSDRTVDLNGKVLTFSQGGNIFLNLDPTVDAEEAVLSAYNITDDGNEAKVAAQTSNTEAVFRLRATFNGLKEAQVVGFVDVTTATLAYTADTHTFNGVINLPVQANASPQDGDVWRVDNTNTGLKIRINGVTKTITVS